MYKGWLSMQSEVFRDMFSIIRRPHVDGRHMMTVRSSLSQTQRWRLGRCCQLSSVADSERRSIALYILASMLM